MKSKKKGLIGYIFQDRPRNWFEAMWWKIKGYFGWKNTTGIPIIVSDKVVKDECWFIDEQANVTSKDWKKIEKIVGITK